MALAGTAQQRHREQEAASSRAPRLLALGGAPASLAARALVGVSPKGQLPAICPEEVWSRASGSQGLDP